MLRQSVLGDVNPLRSDREYELDDNKILGSEFRKLTTRSMIWIDAPEAGWACSNCRWKYPVPQLLTEKAAKDAYDRLASANFKTHTCETVGPPAKERSGYLAERARILIMRGLLPKAAVEVTLHELEFEFRSDPKAMAEARHDAEEFLQKIRKGEI